VKYKETEQTSFRLVIISLVLPNKTGSDQRSIGKTQTEQKMHCPAGLDRLERDAHQINFTVFISDIKLGHS